LHCIFDVLNLNPLNEVTQSNLQVQSIYIYISGVDNLLPGNLPGAAASPCMDILSTLNYSLWEAVYRRTDFLNFIFYFYWNLDETMLWVKCEIKLKYNLWSIVLVQVSSSQTTGSQSIPIWTLWYKFILYVCKITQYCSPKLQNCLWYL